MNDQPVIDPRNVPLWTAASFVLALLAFVMATVGLYRVQLSAALTQAEILTLNRHIAAIRGEPAKTAQAPAAPATPATK